MSAIDQDIINMRCYRKDLDTLYIYIYISTKQACNLLLYLNKLTHHQ